MPEPDNENEKVQDAIAIHNSILYLIESRIPLKIEFPRTRLFWTTFLLEIKNIHHESFLLIDNVRKFETALANRPDAEISLEFREKSGVPCSFRTKVIKCTPEGIWTEIPKMIQRIQKRQYFRIEPPMGSEITFHRQGGKQESARLLNVSAGGGAFALKRGIDLSVGDLLPEVELNIPADARSIIFLITEATVRRVEKDYDYERMVIAIEFTKIPDHTRKDLLAFVLRTQREIIRKIGR